MTTIGGALTDLDGWHLVRIDLAGVGGQQPNIRATGNVSFSDRASARELTGLFGAHSFLRLCASYGHLDPHARHRVRVTYGTPLDRPRIQSLRAGETLVHGPLRLPEGRAEAFVYDIPVPANGEGRLVLTFDPHELPEREGTPNTLADTALVLKIELFADRSPAPLVLDAATVPEGGIVLSALRTPSLSPVVGLDVVASFPDSTTSTLTTDDEGNAISVDPRRIAACAVGHTIRLETQFENARYQAAVEIDDTFSATWPKLTPRTTTAEGLTNETLLDGAWEFSVHADSEGEPTNDSFSAIEVPGQWFQQGFDVPLGSCGVYRTSFSLTPRASRRQILRFDAVYAHAEVFLNGIRLGEHEGGFTPFQFDITDHLSTVNSLIVHTRHDSPTDLVSAASAYAGHPLGGITRSVRVIDVENVHLSRLQISTEFADGIGTAHIVGSLSAVEDGRGDRNVLILVENNAGVGLVETSVRVAEGEDRFSATIVLDSVLPWTAETPVLYRLRASLEASDSEVVQSIGFRSIAVSGQSLLVNDRPIRLRGVERHEQDPLRGRSTTESLWRTDVELMKSANINNVFTCHYPHPEGFLDLCDSEGLWVINESPTVWVSQESADDPADFLTIAMPILEMFERDWSRPAVVVWMLGDECVWGRNFWRLVQWLRNQGPAAPLMFSFDIGGASSLDIASRHYPPVDFETVISGLDRPVTFDQFAHVNCYNRRELVTDPEPRDWWGESFSRYWDSMKNNPGVLGGQIWAWSDDVFHINDGRTIGYGTWGIVDEWRRPKPEWWNLKMVYSPIQVLTTQLDSDTSGNVTIELENNYDFLDLGSVRVDWSTPHEMGTARGEGSARTRGSLTINLLHQLQAGDTVRLEFFDESDRLITVRTVPVGHGVAIPNMGARFSAPSTPVVSVESRARLSSPNLPEFDALRITVGSVEWQVDRELGEIRGGRVERRTILQGGPWPMLLPSTATVTVGPHHRSNIGPLTDLDPEIQTESVTWDSSTLTMSVSLRSEHAATSYSLAVSDDGALELRYVMTALSSMDVRQAGLVLDLPSSFATLRWSRPTYWSSYPEDHIGRSRGTAHARHARDVMINQTDGAARRPNWPWEHDENALGSADFRATRRRIEWASLNDHTGAGLWIEPVLPTDVRAWQHEDSTRLLIAAHSSGGSEPFLLHSKQLGPAQLIVAEGDTLTGAVRMRLGRISADAD